MSDTYTPISCPFYDELEAAAVKQTMNTIVYWQDNEEKTIQARIIDFKTLNKEEFMVLHTKETIRLDKIILFNDMAPNKYENCRIF